MAVMRRKWLFLRDLLEHHEFGAVRTALALRDARREEDFVDAVARRLGVPPLDLQVLKNALGKPGATDFFVLGSGSSVEDLPLHAFDKIRKGVSVGINVWPLHTFVPDIYCFEPVPENDSDHFGTMKLLERADIIDRKPFVLFLKPRSKVEILQLMQVPSALRERTFLYGRFTPFTRSITNLARDTRALLQVLSDGKLRMVLPDSGASVVRMAALGLVLGFRRVVFVGVDLNHTEYFWERNPIYLRRLGLTTWESGQKGKVHETMSGATRPFVVTEMITALSEVASDFGSEMYTVSVSSELAKHLPLFEF